MLLFSNLKLPCRALTPTAINDVAAQHERGVISRAGHVTVHFDGANQKGTGSNVAVCLTFGTPTGDHCEWLLDLIEKRDFLSSGEQFAVGQCARMEWAAVRNVLDSFGALNKCAIAIMDGLNEHFGRHTGSTFAVLKMGSSARFAPYMACTLSRAARCISGH